MVAAEGLHETPPRASRWKPKASEIPREIDESVLLDGCGNLAVIRRMVLPLAKPGLVATAVLCFILAWNESLLANIFTRRVAVTLPVGISKFITEKRILRGCITAAATLARKSHQLSSRGRRDGAVTSRTDRKSAYALAKA